MRDNHRFENVLLKFPAVYEPRCFNGYLERKMYEVTFELPSKQAQALFAAGVHEGRYGFCAKSKYAPIITCDSAHYHTLTRAVEIAKARNLPLNRLFRGMVATVVCHEYRYETPERHGIGLGLTELVIDANHLLEKVIV